MFLSKGARVVMLNRNPDKSTAAIEDLTGEFGADADVSFIRMDLAVLDSVRDAAAEVMEKVPHIDALICNAAIAQVAKQEITVDGFESQLGVNHFGHFLLTSLLIDLMPDDPASRVVSLSSLAHARLTQLMHEFARAQDQRIQALARRRRDGEGAAASVRRVPIVDLGEVPEAEIPAWHRRVALCMAPARNEGFGLTPLEAMASGSAVPTSSASRWKRRAWVCPTFSCVEITIR